MAVSGFQISPALLRLKKTAIPASHPLEADVPSLPRLGFILQHSWIAKKLYRFLAFPEKMGSRGAVLNRIFLPVLYICSVPLNWTWYISFNVAVSYIYPNYSDLTRPHPKWRCGRGTPPTTGLISGKSRLVKYYISARFEFKQVLVVLLKLNIFNKVKLSSSFNNPEKHFKHDYCESGWLVQTGDIHFFYPNGKQPPPPPPPPPPPVPCLPDLSWNVQEGEPEGKWKRPEVEIRGRGFSRFSLPGIYRGKWWFGWDGMLAPNDQYQENITFIWYNIYIYISYIICPNAD